MNHNRVNFDIILSVLFLDRNTKIRKFNKEQNLSLYIFKQCSYINLSFYIKKNNIHNILDGITMRSSIRLGKLC